MTIQHQVMLIRFRVLLEPLVPLSELGIRADGFVDLKSNFDVSLGPGQRLPLHQGDLEQIEIDRSSLSPGQVEFPVDIQQLLTRQKSLFRVGPFGQELDVVIEAPSFHNEFSSFLIFTVAVDT